MFMLPLRECNYAGEYFDAKYFLWLEHAGTQENRAIHDEKSMYILVYFVC